jgi:hypothetical protein
VELASIRFGDISKAEPLVPIPNTVVKRLSANDSAGIARVKVGSCQTIKAP